MSEKFLKFKRKSNAARILKALLGAVSSGLLSAGIFLILSRLCVIDIDTVILIIIGACIFFLSGGALLLILRKSDEALAKELDKRFGLSERATTMLAYKNEEGIMLDVQRADTERSLKRIPLKEYKIRRLWAYFTALGISAAVLIAGFIIPDMRGYEEPQKIEPFALSEMQRAGIEELIKYVEKSEMEEPYRTQIRSELGRLLSVLEVTATMPDMRAALAESMAYILKSTSDSSSMTEIANALWGKSDNQYRRALARLINTGDWKNEKNDWWGYYADNFLAFCALYDHVTVEGEPEKTEQELLSELLWKIESSVMEIETSLADSKITEDDAIYTALYDIVSSNYGDEEHKVLGLKHLSSYIRDEGLGYAESVGLLEELFESVNQKIFDAISQKKINTNVGEYTMTSLSTLFLVPLTGFERPDFTKTGASGDASEDEDEKNDGGSGEGGVGEGATFGSDDYVLDPSTGEYVKYGTLLSKYYAVMTAKLESGNYTEAQKEAITKYFELLYSGLKKEEGK